MCNIPPPCLRNRWNRWNRWKLLLRLKLRNNLVELSHIIEREVYQAERLVFWRWGLDVLYRQRTAPYSYGNNTAVTAI